MSQKVDIVLSTTSIQAVPGETYELGVTVTNNTQEVERFELSISVLDPSWYQFDWADMLLYPTAPGNEGTSYVRITIPPDVRPGTYAPVVEVTGTQSGVIQQPFLLTVNQMEGTEAELSLNPPLQQTKERAGRFQIGLKNPLNQPVTLQLNARSARSDAQIRIFPPLIELEAFSETRSTLELQPLRRNWYKSDQVYDFSVGAEGLNQEVAGSLVQICALPWLRQLLTTPALLAAAVLAPLLLTGLLALLLWPRSTTNQITLQAANCVAPTHNLAATLSERGSTTDIIVSELDGSHPRRVGGEASERLPGMFASLLSLSPDGSNLAYVTANNEQMDNATIYLINLGSSSRQPVTSITSGFWPSHPVWSIDGSQLAYVVRNTDQQLELWTVNLNSADKKATKVGAPRQLEANLFYNDPGEAGPVCWSTDSTRLVIRPVSASRQTEINVNNGQITADVSSKSGSLPLRQASTVNAQLREPQLAPVGAGFCFVPTFSQNDPHWQSVIMKPQGQKLADTGCPIVTSAMLLNYYKVNTDPLQLNTCLDTDADPLTGFDWSLPARRCSLERVQGGNRVDFNWENLNATLKSGLPAIVGMVGGQNGSHYVVVVGGSDSIASTYRVNDPWDGTNYKSLGYFLEKGYHLQWLVNYTSNSSDAPPCPDRTNPGEKFQPGFTLIAPKDGGIYSNTVQIQYEADTGVAVVGTLLGTTSIQANQGAVPGVGLTTGQTTQAVTNGMPVTAEGNYTLSLQNAVTTASSGRLVTHFVVDSTAPTVDFPKQNTIFDPNPKDGFLIARRTVPFELKATDNLSGVALIEYRVNGTEWLPYNFEFGGASVPFDTPGQYFVSYRAKDAAGNYSTEKNLQFIIDLTPAGTPNGVAPTGSAALTPAASPSGAPSEVPQPTPIPTTPPLPGLLTASPPQLVFDPNTLQTSLQLLNSGGGPVTWAIQPLSGPALTYLQFNLTSGIIQPGGGQPLSVELLTPNQTTGAVTANFNIVYNNNTSILPITVQISPQPTPRVQFLSPSIGPLTNRNVPIKLDVIPGGVSKPNHVTIYAKYIDQPGGSIAERQLQGVAVAPDWSLSWDTGQLPPQTPIDLSATICWSADESACVKNVATLTGLSIPKPAVVVTLNPNSDKLGPALDLVAQVTGGTIDHVSYVLTFKDKTGTVTPLTKKGAAPNFNVTFDTSDIPPQTGITLAVLACWGQDDNPANCTGPSNQILTSFSVATPSLTLNPLSDADQKNLPLSMALSGTVANLGKSSQIFVVVKASQKFDSRTGTPAAPTEESFPVNPPASGSNNWTFTMDTSSWPPQAGITFTPKVCWDGIPTGNFCYPSSPASTGAAIPEPSASFVQPGPLDLVNPVSLSTNVTPTNRVNFVKYLISYTSSTAGTVTDLPLNQFGFPTTGNPSTFSLSPTFDSILAGLRPQSGVSFKALACNFSGWCGPASAPLANLNVPASTITPSTLQAQIQDTLDNSGPNARIPIIGTIGGRGSTTVNMLVQYRNDPNNLTDLPVSKQVGDEGSYGYPASGLGKPITFTVTLGDIPPQPGIVLAYNFCWTGELDNNPRNCSVVPVYTLTIPSPRLNNLYLGNNPQPYKKLEVDGGNPNSLIFPVAITDTLSPTQVITMPLSLSAPISSNVTGVKWRVYINGTQVLSQPVTTQLNLITDVPIGISPISPLTLPNAKAADIKLVATPMWSLSRGTPIEYPSGAMTLTVKLVPLNVQLVEAGGTSPSISGSTTTPESKLMYKATTTFNGTFDDTQNLVTRVLITPTYTLGGERYSLFLPGAAPGDPNIPVTGGNWSTNWDHLTVPLQPTTKPTPANPISLLIALCTRPYAQDQTNSSCTPTALNGGGGVRGTLSQIDNLKLVGIRYYVSANPKDDDLVPTRPVDTYLNSTYTVTVELRNVSFNPAAANNTPGVVKGFQVYAYPSPATLGTIPASFSGVKLKILPPQAANYTVQSINADTTRVSFSIYWPDSPDLTDGFLGTIQPTKRVSIGLQYCTITVPGNADTNNNCSDWSGATMQNVSGPDWVAVANGLQAAILTWQSYNADNTPPYNDFLQRSTPSAIDNLKINLYVLDTTLIDVCSVPTTTGTFNSFLDISYKTKGVLNSPRFKDSAPVFTYPLNSDTNQRTFGVGPAVNNAVINATITNGTACSITFSWEKDIKYGAWPFIGGPPFTTLVSTGIAPSYLQVGFPVDPPDAPGSPRGVELSAVLSFKSGTNTFTTGAKVPTHGAVAQPYIISAPISIPEDTNTTTSAHPTSLTATWFTNVPAICQIPTTPAIASTNPTGVNLPPTASLQLGVTENVADLTHKRLLSGLTGIAQETTFRYPVSCQISPLPAVVFSTPTSPNFKIFDNVAPNITSVSATANGTTDLDISWTVTDNPNAVNTISCAISNITGGVYTSIDPAPATGNGTQTIRGLTSAAGTVYTITVSCTDTVGQPVGVPRNNNTRQTTFTR